MYIVVFLYGSRFYFYITIILNTSCLKSTIILYISLDSSRVTVTLVSRFISMDESELEVKGSSDSKQSGDATPGQKRPRDGEPPAEVTRDSKYMSGVTSAQSSAVSSASSSVSKATLELYYSRLFPVSQMFAWIRFVSIFCTLYILEALYALADSCCSCAMISLARCVSSRLPLVLFDVGIVFCSYGTNDPAVAAKREYCITMRTQEKDEVFVRYSCCPTKEALRNLLRRDSLVDFVTKLDIGPIYNTDVTNHKSGVQFYPEEKELVFDIDMDAYDGVRTCCKGKHVCPKCWKFLTCALKVLNRALREDFGFKHILFVYSGRRGIHCWVCDKKARSLTNHGREAVASYLAVNVNSLILPLVKDSTAIDDNGRPEQVPQNTFNHPSLVRAMAILKPIMNSLLDEQGILVRLHGL